MSANTGRGEHIGTQINSADGVVSGGFDQGPPISFEQRLVRQPIRDSLLSDGGMARRPQSLRKSSLTTAGNRDSALKRSNVRFIHEHARYTRFLVDVNKDGCFSADKETCTVLTMPTPKKKAQLRPAPKREKRSKLAIGPDGLTFPQRLQKLMDEHGIGQTALAKRCSEYLAIYYPGEEDKIKQQHIFNILGGQASSEALPIIAQVLDVSDIWLQYGIGSRERPTKH